MQAPQPVLKIQPISTAKLSGVMPITSVRDFLWFGSPLHEVNFQVMHIARLDPSTGLSDYGGHTDPRRRIPMSRPKGISGDAFLRPAYCLLHLERVASARPPNPSG
jgi:hypothetical protein